MITVGECACKDSWLLKDMYKGALAVCYKVSYIFNFLPMSIFVIYVAILCFTKVGRNQGVGTRVSTEVVFSLPVEYRIFCAIHGIPCNPALFWLWNFPEFLAFSHTEFRMYCGSTFISAQKNIRALSWGTGGMSWGWNDPAKQFHFAGHPSLSSTCNCLFYGL